MLCMRLLFVTLNIQSKILINAINSVEIKEIYAYISSMYANILVYLSELNGEIYHLCVDIRSQLIIDAY